MSDADLINHATAAVLDRLLPVLTADRPAPEAGAQELREGIDKLRRQLNATEKQFAQRRVVFDSLLPAIQNSPGWKLTAPLRALWQWLKSPGFAAGALIPWHNLEPAPEAGPGGWRAAGDDPQFLTPCLLPAGWLRVRLRLRRRDDERPTREQAELYADFGRGIRAEDCLHRFAWSETLADDLCLWLPEPAQAIRFDPLDSPGTFALEEFRVESIRGPRALLLALRQKLSLLKQYRCTGAVLRRGLGLLMRGRWSEVRNKLFRGLTDARMLRPEGDAANELYAHWRHRLALTDADRTRLRAEAEALADPPLISVLMPVCDPPPAYLKRAILSVQRQTYPHWELCIADDASTDPAVRQLLRESAESDPRIQVTYRDRRGGISAASNDALALARGGHVALLDHDDELAEHALSLVARELRAYPRADFLYSDEDKLELDGRHADPFLKPDWSPEFFLACMYTCHLGVYRTEVVRRVGGFRSAFDLAQDYDLALRVVAEIETSSPLTPGTSPPRGEGSSFPALSPKGRGVGGEGIRAALAERIRHIPEVLYHWRKLPHSTATGHEAKPDAERAARRALESYVAMTGRDAVVEPGPVPGYHRVRYSLRERPKVSLIIPSAGQPNTAREEPAYYVQHCVESIRSRTTYEHYEILVVDNDDLAPELAERLDELGVVRVPYAAAGRLNLSAKMNLGAAKADGEQLVFLNDDTEVLSGDWLECLLEYAQQLDVGAVGAKLFFPDGRLQHVGVTLLEGRPGHPFYGFPGTSAGYFCGTLVPRNYSAVTGACLMTRAELFRAAGGFDETFHLHYNDVDYCLRLLAAGQRIVWTPYAQLYHFESASKEAIVPEELEVFLAKWARAVSLDPYYHPHLTMHYHDYRLGDGG